ncbi:MAG: DUF5615 family PIN-like protein, partial [Planctomycetaceae bacterium]
FLVDAQLPRRMTVWFVEAGCDALHTLGLPAGNRSTDEQIRRIAENDQRVLISKDADFVDSHLLIGHPQKLLLISTGNVSNAALASLIVPLIPELDRLFQAHSFLELTSEGLVQRD